MSHAKTMGVDPKEIARKLAAYAVTPESKFLNANSKLVVSDFIRSCRGADVPSALSEEEMGYLVLVGMDTLLQVGQG